MLVNSDFVLSQFGRKKVVDYNDECYSCSAEETLAPLKNVKHKNGDNSVETMSHDDFNTMLHGIADEVSMTTVA